MDVIHDGAILATWQHQESTVCYHQNRQNIFKKDQMISHNEYEYIGGQFDDLNKYICVIHLIFCFSIYTFYKFIRLRIIYTFNKKNAMAYIDELLPI